MLQFFLQLAHFMVKVVASLLHRALQSLRLCFDLALQFAQFLQLHAGRHVHLHPVDVTLQTSPPLPHATRHRGQALRADDHERHDHDDHNFRKAYVEHQRSPVGLLHLIQHNLQTLPAPCNYFASATCSPSRSCLGESSSDFIPSLNPLTAPPKSLPMLRSFLVPNTSTTTNSTISQCQILNEPISLSSSIKVFDEHLNA